MELVFSIDEQDSLLENSQMKMLINSNKKSSGLIQRRPSLTVFSTQAIPNQTMMRNVKIFFSPKKVGLFRSHSVTFSNKNSSIKKTFLQSRKLNPQSFKKISIEKSQAINRIIQENNRNLQLTMHKIDLAKLWRSAARDTPGLTKIKKKSLFTLKSKAEVELQKRINKKQVKNCPFEPSYLQSEYLT